MDSEEPDEGIDEEVWEEPDLWWTGKADPPTTKELADLPVNLCEPMRLLDGQLCCEACATWALGDCGECGTESLEGCRHVREEGLPLERERTVTEGARGEDGKVACSICGRTWTRVTVSRVWVRQDCS